ncbi:MAG: hypothetical protein AB7P20_28765 [Rhizobiaceae bacterium]
MRANLLALALGLAVAAASAIDCQAMEVAGPANWSRHYAATRIDTSKGERWFCTEAEAKATGWRAPYR